MRMTVLRVAFVANSLQQGSNTRQRAVLSGFEPALWSFQTCRSSSGPSFLPQIVYAHFQTVTEINWIENQFEKLFTHHTSLKLLFK